MADGVQFLGTDFKMPNQRISDPIIKFLTLLQQDRIVSAAINFFETELRCVLGVDLVNGPFDNRPVALELFVKRRFAASRLHIHN